MLDRAIFALDLRRRRAREGPLKGPGGVIFRVYNMPDLFRARKSPGTGDREVEISEISLDSIENRNPPLLFRRRIMRPLIR